MGDIDAWFSDNSGGFPSAQDVPGVEVWACGKVRGAESICLCDPHEVCPQHLGWNGGHVHLLQVTAVDILLHG